MNTAVNFNLNQIPLVGRHLIEASAGTGKTYTIAGLYTRLIVEKDLDVSRILVMTFTNAATEELRARLRLALLNALDVISGDNIDSEDPFLRQLVIQQSQNSELRNKAIRRLKLAICNFDQSSIYTIHGFCQRVLKDVALEADVAFENEIVRDDSELCQQLVDDFWRQRFYHATSQELNQIEHCGLTPETLSNRLSKWISKPYLNILPLQQDRFCESIEDEVQIALEKARKIWDESSQEIKTLLTEHKGLDKRSYSKKNLPNWLEQLEYMLESGVVNLDQTAAVRLGTSGLIEKTKHGFEPPEHEFFEAWELLVSLTTQQQICYQQAMNQLHLDCLHYLRTELKRIKDERNLLNYDDLLVTLHNALFSEQGGELADQVSRQFPVALVDEFQDTDPVQYEIFDAIYHQTNRAGHALFLVGDPKQAIYSFRGADIYTYLRARKAVGQPWWTLTENWRSSQCMVTAINYLFENNKRPFWLSEIDYQKVTAAQGEKLDTHLPETLSAFRCWVINNQNEPDKLLPKKNVTPLVVEAVANEIADLLNQGEAEEYLLDGRALCGGDIAVLVRKKIQGELIRDALTQRGIASVMLTQESVFDTREAQELARILDAVLQPANQGLIRAALATEILGLTAAQIADFESEDPLAQQSWDYWLECFRQWHEKWLAHGFMQIFRGILEAGQCYQRWLRMTDGERRMTNLLHLGELVNNKSKQNSLGLQALVNWFHRQREVDNEEAELRLESDENLVKIVTIHASKGLEYNLVFSPFLWDGQSLSRANDRVEPFAYHDPELEYTTCLDMGSEKRDYGKQLAKNEVFAEDLRLLYVALTRAKYHCTLITGHVEGIQYSALGWLLYGDEQVIDVDEAVSYIKNMSASTRLEKLKTLVDKTAEVIQCFELPENNIIPFRQKQQQQGITTPRKFSGNIPVVRQFASFSLLTQGIEHQYQQLDDDELDINLDIHQAANQFPVGIQAGICLHKIFEQLDFSRPVVEQQSMIQEAFYTSHFADQLTEMVIPWLQGVLVTPLNVESGFCLQKLTRQNRIDELGFFYPIDNLDITDLRNLLWRNCSSTHFQSAINQLTFQAIRGWMRGSIDLVYRENGRYYLVDYKSNWLGHDYPAYRADNLIKTIADRHYYLQYLIYSVALHRFLQLRLKDYKYHSHFGGVYYLFIRGMSAQSPGSGIYYNQPAQQLVSELDNLFSGRKVA